MVSDGVEMGGEESEAAGRIWERFAYEACRGSRLGLL